MWAVICTGTTDCDVGVELARLTWIHTYNIIILSTTQVGMCWEGTFIATV